MELDKIIQNLQSKENIDCVFLTGSYGTGRKEYSDIDLVIILKENKDNLRSIFKWIDGAFSDIFIFDHSDLNRINESGILQVNSMDAIFISWLEKAAIIFDKSGKVSGLVTDLTRLKAKSSILPTEKLQIWQKINYNFVANKRYFMSNDSQYHEALEMRLLYSISELIVGYLTLRDIPWRGEKHAVKVLKETAKEFYSAFINYTKVIDLKSRFGAYSSMFDLVFPNGFDHWSESDAIVIDRDGNVSDKKNGGDIFVD